MTPTPSLIRLRPAGPLETARRRIADALQRAGARRAARRTADALRGLDAATLSDLGIDASACGAIGAELHGLAQPSHVRVLRMLATRADDCFPFPTDVPQPCPERLIP